MLRTRGWKYRVFLRYLRIFKYASFSWNRGGFLESYYTLMRYLDDIVDGDARLPEGYANASDYILSKIIFARHPHLPTDAVDYLMLHCFDLAKKFGADFTAETEDILRSLLFDAGRRGKRKIFSAEELQAHFHKLDIRGTIRATLKIFKEDPAKYVLLDALGTATRYQYDLEDFREDIRAGYVNIPAEECAQFGISQHTFLTLKAPEIIRWKRHHAQEGLRLLDEHRRILPQGHFSWLSRATFLLVYERPARKYFRKLLAETAAPQEEQLELAQLHG